MISDLIDRASEYCRRRERELLLQNKLGSGVHGSVLLVIEMTVVTRPFVLDFAGAYLDRAPDYDAETLEEWRKEKVEQFEENWPAAESILYSLECYGIFVADVNPGNIAFVEEENP